VKTDGDVLDLLVNGLYLRDGRKVGWRLFNEPDQGITLSIENLRIDRLFTAACREPWQTVQEILHALVELNDAWGKIRRYDGYT